MATISDVARMAGVSLSTVSYALSGKRPIKEETRRRIFEAMETLDFSPSALARGLAGQRSGMIALLCPVRERALGRSEMEVVSGAFNRAQKDGFQLLMWMTEVSELDELRGLLRQKLVEGVLVMEVHMDDERIGLLQEAGLPFVLLGRNFDPSAFDYTDTDFEQAVRISLEHFTALGHRELVFLNQPDDLLNRGYAPVIRVENAVRAIAAEQGLGLFVRRVGPTREEGRQAYAECRIARPEATAILSLTELGTAAFTAAAIEDGRRVPEDISIINLVVSDAVAEMSQPALTTVGPGLSNIGWSGADILIRRLNTADEGPIQTLISNELIVRASTAQRRS